MNPSPNLCMLAQAHFLTDLQKKKGEHSYHQKKIHLVLSQYALYQRVLVQPASKEDVYSRTSLIRPLDLTTKIGRV